MDSFADIFLDILFWGMVIGAVSCGLAWRNEIMSILKKYVMVIVGLLIVFLGIFLFLTGFYNGYDKSTLTSRYSYSVELTTDSKLENPTFIVPIPIGNESLVNMAVNESIHDFFNPAQKSDGWNVSIVETKYGKMLKISAKEFVPQVHTNVELNPGNNLPTGSSTSFTRGNKEVAATIVADHFIDTINASENEPILSQKFNLTTLQPSAYIQKTFSYDSIIYADYTSSQDAIVEVFVTLQGTNEWWQGDSAFNSYHERLGATFKGEKHGWFSVIGGLTEGEGFRSPLHE